LGQKTNPVGFRLCVTRNWESQWFDEKNFGKMLNEDLLIKKYIRKRIPDGAIASIKIERTPKKVLLELNTARPGVVIGKKGSEIDKVKEELKKLINKEVQINIKEIKHPELDALLIAQNISRQLEGKVSFRRAMKRAITSAMRLGAEGIKLTCSGRLAGAEMARTESGTVLER
jgi:small subunit ribosomal protein S3